MLASNSHCSKGSLCFNMQVAKVPRKQGPVTSLHLFHMVSRRAQSSVLYFHPLYSTSLWHNQMPHGFSSYVCRRHRIIPVCRVQWCAGSAESNAVLHSWRQTLDYAQAPGLNEPKTKALLANPFSSSDLPLSLQNGHINMFLIVLTCILAVIFDQKLSMKNQINKVCQLAFSELSKTLFHHRSH